MAHEKKNPAGLGNLTGGGRGSGAEEGGSSVVNHSRSRSESQAAVEVYDELGSGFYPIDNRFIDEGYAAAISCHGVAVYNVLKRHARAGLGEVWPSYERIAQRSGVSYRMVMEAVSALEALGLIRVTREPGRSNVILLTTADKWRAAGSFIDAHGREVTIDVMDIKSRWTGKRRRGRPRGGVQSPLLEAPGDEKPPRPARTFSENPRALRVPTPAQSAYEQESGDQKTFRSEQETSSSCVEGDGDHVTTYDQTQNDDDVLNLTGNEITLDPEPEDLDNEPSNGSTLPTVVVDRESGVIAPAASVEAQAAIWALLEVAPDFDDAAGFVAKHGELVGLVACDLLTNPDKIDNLRNPAGFLRRAVERGIHPNGSAHARWRAIIAAIEAGEDPHEPEEDPDSYEALMRKFVPAGWEDIVLH